MGERVSFSTKLGVIAATAGSSIGLGNIWRFPYEVGQHGGAAFILVYIICILVLVMPVMMAEFIIGRGSRTNASHAFTKLAPHSWWKIVGYICISAPVIIVGFYFVISGWSLEYVVQSLTPGGMAISSSEAFTEEFTQFTTSPIKPLVWVILFILINHIILVRGVNRGIEKASNILMPLLFLILVVFCIRSVFLSGFTKGINFLFNPDFSKITTEIVLQAMGQAFFSMSVGMGILITYASYYSKETSLLRVTATVAVFDLLVAILAGMIIFPTVFTFGISPSQGPELIFITLPNLFNHMPLGWLWSSLFFILVSLAALTSTISLSEVSIAYLQDSRQFSRQKATTVMTGIYICLAALCSLSFGVLNGFRIFGMTIFNFFDFLSSNILLPIGGIFISIFVGWKINRKFVCRELSDGRGSARWYLVPVLFCLRFIAPVAIFLIFLSGLHLL
ncbi:MAG: sodium-dependent transporter [Porphyromonadaceae bacterium]|nr:sodium-dependent transporter [Porphyromonadaceae bacterium]